MPLCIAILIWKPHNYTVSLVFASCYTLLAMQRPSQYYTHWNTSSWPQQPWISKTTTVVDRGRASLSAICFAGHELSRNQLHIGHFCIAQLVSCITAPQGFEGGDRFDDGHNRGGSHMASRGSGRMGRRRGVLDGPMTAGPMMGAPMGQVLLPAPGDHWMLESDERLGCLHECDVVVRQFLKKTVLTRCPLRASPDTWIEHQVLS